MGNSVKPDKIGETATFGFQLQNLIYRSENGK